MRVNILYVIDFRLRFGYAEELDVTARMKGEVDQEVEMKVFNAQVCLMLTQRNAELPFHRTKAIL